MYKQYVLIDARIPPHLIRILGKSAACEPVYFDPSWPASSGFCGGLFQEYRENTIDTMWLDGLIASKAITPSLGVNEARTESAAVLC